MDGKLKAGNDNSELRIVMPEIYQTKSSDVWMDLEASLQTKMEIVLDFLNLQGEAPTNSDKSSASISRRVFSLVVARPKCNITIPKDKFGIPSEADLYVFAQNHRSVSFMAEEEIDAFETCISDLSEQMSNHLQVFA